MTFTAPKFATQRTAGLVGAEAPVTDPLIVTLYGSREGSDETEVLAEQVTLPGRRVTMTYDDRAQNWSLWTSYARTTGDSRPAEPAHSSNTSASEQELSLDVPLVQGGVVRFSGTLPLRARANIKVVDVAGRLVASPWIQVYPGGSFAATWNSPHVRPGIYFVRLASNQGAVVRRLIVLK